MNARRALSAVAGVSLVYDLVIGLALLAAADGVASLFGMVVPEPRLFVTLTGLFLVCVGLGYALPLQDPDRHRAYLWIFGPLLKGAGACVFVWYYATAAGPASYLLFAASDGVLAIATFTALSMKTTSEVVSEPVSGQRPRR